MRTGEDRQQQSVGLVLLSVASSLNDVDATLLFVDQGLRHGLAKDLQHWRLEVPLKQLAQLAEKGQNPAAMVMQARTMELQGQRDDALSMFWKATNAATAEGQREKDHLASLSEAWEGIARLSAKLRRPEQEIEALEIAATRYDNAKAFFLLGVRNGQKSLEQSLEHHKKAAISGIGDAAVKLGMWHAVLADAYQEPAVNKSSSFLEASHSDGLEDGRIAEEWLSVGADSDNCTSQGYARFHAARLMRKRGDSVKSMDMLRLAVEQSPLKPEAQAQLQDAWAKSPFDLTIPQLDELIGLCEPQGTW